ncbi:hypothetical protein K438DRAFT_1981192 [Mycena galopus ATCC 62051]|nr:hypothetical protein K438DRAFT_1981192 [Mycena galopus ATCC 62051]
MSSQHQSTDFGVLELAYPHHRPTSPICGLPDVMLHDVQLSLSPPNASASHTRSPSPTTGDKRARSPSDEDLRPTQGQCTTSSGTRPKAKDFDDVTQEVISLAITEYRVLLSSEYAFPESPAELSYLGRAWTTSCTKLNVVIELTPTISKLVRGRGSHMRGELKTKVKPLAELMYEFASGQNKKTIAANRQRSEELKENLTFTFRDIKGRKGIYRHLLLQKLVNAMWFANRRDEGPRYPAVFNPFPKAALALVLTAVENCIDEWATGIRTDIPFTSSEYRRVYDSHIEALNRFETQTQPHKILGNILVRLHNLGRFHSGAQPITVTSTSILRPDDLAAAIQEYREDSETESDGENGEDDGEHNP